MKKSKTPPPNNTEEKYVITAKEYAELSQSEREMYDPVKKKYEKLPLASIILFCTAGLGILLYITCFFSKSFSDFFNFKISHWFRLVFAKISGIVPFSLAEALIILLPILIVAIVLYVWKHRCKTWKSTGIAVLNILAILAFVLSTFAFNFSAGYKGHALASKLDLDRQKVTPTELYNSTEYLISEAIKESQYVQFGEDGFSDMPYGIAEMNDKLLKAYEKFCADYDFMKTFDSRVKPVMLSEAMSYTHITGVYTFFTGEANINVEFPDYTIPYTAAHELAHQRGIAKEDEANLIAFLVCTYSDDHYIRYSGFVNMYEYVAAALKKADRDLFNTSYSHLNAKIINEQIAYSNFFKKYQKSVAATVSNKVNDTYLKSQGTVGSASYGMVVDLTVAHLKDKNLIE